VEYIMDEELHWETALMCDWEFARRVRTTITTMEYKQQVKDTPCICIGYFSILANQNKILHKKNLNVSIFRFQIYINKFSANRN